VLESRPRARVVRQSGVGKGDAIKLDLAQAVGDIVGTMDGDGSHRAPPRRRALFQTVAALNLQIEREQISRPGQLC
jgi:hypothetical protein